MSSSIKMSFAIFAISVTLLISPAVGIQLTINETSVTTSESIIASSRTQRARFLAAPGMKTPMLISPRQHHTLKLTVNSNPKALRRAGNFPGDVEWVPLNPVEYKNATVTREISNRTQNRLHWRRNPPPMTGGHSYFERVTTVKSKQVSQMMWMHKLSPDLDQKINHQRISNREGIRVENAFTIKSGGLKLVQNSTVKSGLLKIIQKTPNPVNKSRIEKENSNKSKIWIPVSISAPPLRIMTNKTTINADTKTDTVTPYKWHTGYEADYFHTSEDPLTSALLSEVLAENHHVEEYSPTTTRKPDSTPLFAYLTRPWLTTTQKYSGLVRRSSTTPFPSTTFTVTAHPLVVTSELTSNELSISDIGNQLDWTSSTENSFESEYTTAKPFFSTPNYKPIRQTTGKIKTKSTTTQSPNDRIMYNKYTTPKPYYVTYGSPSYVTTQYPLNEHNALNSVVSFLATASNYDIAQSASATKKPNKKPYKKPTKRPQYGYGSTVGYGTGHKPVTNSASGSSGSGSRRGQNRLQRLLLAIGMSVIPTAALAVLVGFPTLLVGRRRRDLDDRDSAQEFIDRMKLLEDSKQPDVWMNDADVTLQNYCSKMPLKKRKLKKRLRGNRAWKGVADAVRSLLSAKCNVSGDLMGINKGGLSGLIYFPTSPGQGSLIKSKSQTKRRGSGMRPPSDLEIEPLSAVSFDWDEFVCKTFWTLVDDEIEGNDNEKSGGNSTVKKKIGDEGRNNNGTTVAKLKFSSRLENSKSAARKFHSLNKPKKPSNSTKEPMAMIIVHHTYGTDGNKKQSKMSNITLDVNATITDRNNSTKVTGMRNTAPIWDFNKNWRFFDFFPAKSNSFRIRQRLSEKLKLTKNTALPLSSSSFSRTRRTVRSTPPTHGLRMSIKAMMHRMKDDGSANAISREQLSSFDLVEPKSTQSPLSRISENLKEGKLYIYHILSSPKRNTTTKISKRKRVNVKRRRIATTTKSSLLTEPSRIESHKKLKVKGTKFTSEEDEEIERMNANYGMPTIFRIPIHVENSTPEYMHILGKPIPWSIVENISANYLGKPNIPKLTTTTRRPIQVHQFNTRPEIYKPEDDYSATTSQTSSFSLNSSSATGPMTINIYTVHGLENGLLGQILNNLPGIIESQTDPSPEYYDEVQEITTRRPLRPITVRTRPNLPYTTTRRYRPTIGRPFRPCIRPFGRQEVIDDCADEELAPPTDQAATTSRRPPINKTPMVSLIDLIHQKLGLHGGLLPLLDLGKWTKGGYTSTNKWSSIKKYNRPQLVNVGALGRINSDIQLDEDRKPQLFKDEKKSEETSSDPAGEVAKLMKNFLVNEYSKLSKNNEVKRENEISTKTINVFISPDKKLMKKGKIEKIVKL